MIASRLAATLFDLSTVCRRAGRVVWKPGAMPPMSSDCLHATLSLLNFPSPMSFSLEISGHRYRRSILVGTSDLHGILPIAKPGAHRFLCPPHDSCGLMMGVNAPAFYLRRTFVRLISRIGLAVHLVLKVYF
jgi:hypothetical protein